MGVSTSVRNVGKGGKCRHASDGMSVRGSPPGGRERRRVVQSNPQARRGASLDHRTERLRAVANQHLRLWSPSPSSFALCAPNIVEEGGFCELRLRKRSEKSWMACNAASEATEAAPFGPFCPRYPGRRIHARSIARTLFRQFHDELLGS